MFPGPKIENKLVPWNKENETPTLINKETKIESTFYWDGVFRAFVADYLICSCEGVQALGKGDVDKTLGVRDTLWFTKHVHIIIEQFKSIQY